MQPAPAPYATDGEYIRMTDVEVTKRLEELKMFTRQTLNVEQRIEIARQQQAIRDAKKIAKEELAKSKEKARHAKEIERNERLEAQRKERELKNQQALEVSAAAVTPCKTNSNTHSLFRRSLVQTKRKKAEEAEKIRQEEIQRKQQVRLAPLPSRFLRRQGVFDKKKKHSLVCLVENCLIRYRNIV